MSHPIVLPNREDKPVQVIRVETAEPKEIDEHVERVMDFQIIIDGHGDKVITGISTGMKLMKYTLL